MDYGSYPNTHSRIHTQTFLQTRCTCAMHSRCKCTRIPTPVSIHRLTQCRLALCHVFHHLAVLWPAPRLQQKLRLNSKRTWLFARWTSDGTTGKCAEKHVFVALLSPWSDAEVAINVTSILVLDFF